VDIQHDVLIIGSGLAGLRAAVELRDRADIAVVSKILPTRSHSGAAQGGITATLGNEEEDKWEWHMYDTVKGSDYLGDQDVIEILTRDAPRAILELEHMGVPFSRREDGRIAQRAFGGHTRDFGKAPVKRACYASDRTGRVILDTLFEQCVKADVRFYSEYYMMDLIIHGDVCSGAILMDLATGSLHTVRAKAVLLATGGSGKVFKTTSNCFANTGDSLSIVYQKGIPLQDMEFVQFHPTGIRGFGILISEAVRGEGGILRNDSGERFMERYAPSIKDLAPRDIVARSIMREIQAGRGIGGGDYVHLDMTHLDEKTINDKLWEITSFARIYAGVDPVTEPIPVQPTCHYMMGGIPTDSNGQVLKNGRGDQVKGLYAAGECACVSVHGANRLGTNSLLDLVVFGRRAGKAIKEWVDKTEIGGEANKEKILISEKIKDLFASGGKESIPVLRDELQQAMTEHCSVFRQEEGLQEMEDVLLNLRKRYRNAGVASKNRNFNYELMDAIEFGHLLDVAETIVKGAQNRKESRGAHYRDDFSERDDHNFLFHTLVFKEGEKTRIEPRPVSVTRFEPKPRKY